MNQINFFSICADVLFDSNNSISSYTFHTDFSIFFFFSTISFLIEAEKENFIFSANLHRIWKEMGIQEFAHWKSNFNRIQYFT